MPLIKVMTGNKTPREAGRQGTIQNHLAGAAGLAGATGAAGAGGITGAIIGAIGAVPAPKFIGLKTDAENRAATQAVSEGKNRLTNQYAIRLMTSEADANDLAGIVAAVSPDAGDYKLRFAVAGSEVEITATGVQERGVSGQATGKWKNR